MNPEIISLHVKPGFSHPSDGRRKAISTGQPIKNKWSLETRLLKHFDHENTQTLASLYQLSVNSYTGPTKP